MPDPARILQESYDRARQEYGAAIGQRRAELVTPALVLDIDAAQRNIDHMASELKSIGGATIRPHYKTHKSPDLARRQLAAGARGLSMATVWEAAILAAAGMDDLFVVNTVAHPAKLRALAELARDHRILVAVDEVPNAEALSAAATAAGSTLGIMVEVDTGMDRCGVDSAADALALARRVADLPGLRFEGITGYEGHCSLTRDNDLRHERQREAMAFFTGVAALLEADGIGCPIRSAGGIATWNWTAAFPGMTEIQAGTYVVMDNFHGVMVPGFEHSLTIQATVISRQSGHGHRGRGQQIRGRPGRRDDRGPRPAGVPVRRGARHLRRDRRLDAARRGRGGAGAGYSPSTVNWYDVYHVVQDDVVVDVWPIIPRGPGHHGISDMG